MSIPGLLRVPIESSNLEEKVLLKTFSLKEYTVPEIHRRGKCRPFSDFEKLSRIAEGSCANVYKVRDRSSNEIAALKRLKIELELMPQNFLREITILKLLNHENIVNLTDVVVGDNMESTGLVLEYCKYSLSNVLDDDPHVLKYPQIKNIMHQLFTGLDFIHKHCICHRDLNPANILFNEMGILKIADFDSSRKITTGNFTPHIGTVWYRPPEILFGSVNYTSSVDIWSAGCVFAEILQQKALFRGDSCCDIIKLIIDLLGSPTEKEWPGHSQLPLLQDYELQSQPYNKIRYTFRHESNATVSLICSLILYNPSSRLSAEQCLKHPYFRELPKVCTLKDLLHMLQATEKI